MRPGHSRLWLVSSLFTCTWFVLRATEACAEPELIGGGHLAYGLGGALAAPGEPSRFRHHVELVAAAGVGRSEWAHMPTGLAGPLLGASALLGIGPSPSYLLIDAGWEGVERANMTSTAFGCFLEGGTRVSPSSAPVLGLRAALSVAYINLGIRALASLERNPEIATWLTLGIGNF